MSRMAKEKKKKGWNGFSLRPRREMPEGLWLACPGCSQMLFRKTMEENLHVCPECNHHFRVDGPTRIAQLADVGTFEEFGADLASSDPLKFTWGQQKYQDRIRVDPADSRAHEALLAGKAFIKGRPVMLAVMNFSFLGGSMGMVVGEKFCLAVDRALEEKLPLVVVSC